MQLQASIVPPAPQRPAGKKHLTSMIRHMSSELSFMPFADLMGFKMIAAAPGEVQVDLPATVRHHNPMGTVHGGALAALADAATGMAVISILDDDEAFTTLELKTNFVKPVRTSILSAHGKVVTNGKTIVLVEAKIFDSDGRLVALATSTCMKLRGDTAQGRSLN